MSRNSSITYSNGQDRLIMKRVLLILFFLGWLLLHCQANGRRFLLGVKIEKTGNQVASDDEPGKSGTDEKPVTALVPTIDTKSDNGTSSKSNTRNSNKDESNNGYGTFGNPSGSSTGRV
ncbi:uncharacterized protein LOC110428549 [Herrania umbratica]|uniref:Uncharacterized protein LOC110428549 n=1 Tax=Herrania umbratica TaxID=108875 RepID=A0A6J1BP75_9ROSI|nr:uncharacterized protein LOC110428549 [Herrania umbratica]